MDKIFSIFTRENITLVLSIFGAIGTSVTWLYSFLKTRKKFTIQSNGYMFSPKGLLLHVQLSNKSTLPLSINEIAFKNFGTEYLCDKIPKKVFEETNKSGKEVLSHKEYYSIEFPINIPPLCGASGYLYFSSEKENFPPLSNDLTVIIRTNRGKAVEKKLSLNQLLK